MSMIHMTLVNREGKQLWSGEVPSVPREGDEIETSIPAENDSDTKWHGVVRKVTWRFVRGPVRRVYARVVVG